MIFDVPYCHASTGQRKNARAVYERDKFAILAKYAMGDFEAPARCSVVLEISRKNNHGTPRLYNIAAQTMKTLNETGLLIGKRVVRLKIKRGKRKENRTRLVINDYDKNPQNRAAE